MQVPFLDLHVQHEPLRPELVDAFRQVAENSAFAGGPFAARFAREPSRSMYPELRAEQIELVVNTLKDRLCC